MTLIPNEERLSERMVVETSSGAWMGNTERMAGFLVGIRCEPATATTRYTLEVTDPDGFVIYHQAAVKGQLVENIDRVAVRGIHTVSISQASADEAFSLKLMVEGG